jgi:peroxiredoxin
LYQEKEGDGLMDLIKVGDIAPDFSLRDNNGNKVSLSDFKGKKVLLSWHPLAWTGVCMDQMRSLENNWDEFQKLNTVPLGLSVDPPPSKKAWAFVILLENVKILSDFRPLGKTAIEYGVYIEKAGISQRANIIIDEEGIVKWVKVYPRDQLPDIKEVIQEISKM